MKTNIVPEIRQYSPTDIEEANFRIDSSGWIQKADENGIRYLENPEGDVKELLDGPYVGQQYFQNDGALERELSKAGKRIMTPEEWETFIVRHTDWAMINLPRAGSFFSTVGQFGNQDRYASYWTDSFDKPGAWVMDVEDGEAHPTVFDEDGFPVRCLKN